MHISRNIMLVIYLVFLLIISGCGGDFSSLDSELQVSEMSDDEVATYCEEEADYFRSSISESKIKDIECMSLGIEEAMYGDGQVSTCEQSYNSCLNSSMEIPEYSPSCQLQYIDRSTCDVTLGQVQDCAREEVGEINQIASQMSCDMVQNPPDDTFRDGFGPACQELYDNCPDF